MRVNHPLLAAPALAFSLVVAADGCSTDSTSPSGSGASSGSGATSSAPIARVERVRIALGATYDVLPDSETGTYFAAGTLVGSTMAAYR